MMSSQNTLHLVDSIEYANNNCFQHQLTKSLQIHPSVRTVALSDLQNVSFQYDKVICCLKQRTLHKHVDFIKNCLGSKPVTAYDQDAWEAFRDDSPYKGTYQLVASKLNVMSYAVTSKPWSDFIVSQGLPSQFVRMWVLPDYCDSMPSYEDRSINIGFIESLHAYRKKLFDFLDASQGIQVNVQSGNSLPYKEYLRSLSSLRVFIHSEDAPLFVDGKEMNLKDALWVKDIEAASRGCFSIRNRGKDANSYFEGIETVFLYDDPREIPSIIEHVQKMDTTQRQETINRSVEFIKRSNKWAETASKLLVPT